MTDTFQKSLHYTLEAVWGLEGFSTWVEAIPPSLGGLSPLQSDLLLAGMALLNWDMPRLNLFLKKKMAIAKIQDLKSTQIDTFFDHLNEAIADWLNNRIEGGQGASLSSLSCQYWEARLALYPQSVQPPKKRKKWLIDGYQPPEYTPKIPKKTAPITGADPDPVPPDDWRFWDYPDENYW